MTRKHQNYLKLGTGHDKIDSLELLTVDECTKAKVCFICALKNNSSDGKLFYCGGCHKVLYCSIKHQKSHWNKHKADCKQKHSNT